MKKKALALLLAVSCTVMLVGCGDKKAEEAPTVETTEEPVIQIGEVEPEPEEEVVEEEAVEEEEVREGFYRSELTNEWIDESLKNQRPIAAMVDNEKTALPHFGVNDADIVYEMTNSAKNGGITRLMCIMKDWGSIEQLGSIRSVRPTHLQIAPEYNAVVCHDGGPFWIDNFIKQDFVKHFSGTFSRVNNGKSREFTEYILSGDLDKNFNNVSFTPEYDDYYQGGDGIQHFKFASEKNPVDLSSAAGSDDATDIKLPFDHNSSELTYNSEDGLYYYSEYGSKHVDGKTGEQTAFKNVILMSAKMNVLDDEGYMQFIVSPISNNEGWYVTNGKVIPITWSRTDDINFTKYYDKDGNEITLNTGHTYIAIVPSEDYSDITFN